MASIVFRTGKPKPWLAQINRKGHRIFSRSFVQKKDAERWAVEQERTIDLTGLPLTIEELKKKTVGDLVDRYLRDVTPTKASAENERLTLEKFKKHPMCQKSLAYLSSTDGAAYRDQRLKDTWKSKGTKGPGKLIKPSTIRRQVNILHNIFEVARTEWGLTNLVNPFAGLKIKAREINGEIYGTNFRRTRRLEDGELDRLEKARNGCVGRNRYFVPLAMLLAIETGMRLQEIFNLKWTDIQGRRIRIRKSKTDHVKATAGRTIVMTQRAMFIFMSASAHHKGGKDQNVFPMSKTAFSQSWRDLVKRAGIEGLTFHDLRREAGSRFDEAGLTKAEHDLMMGHSNIDIGSIYISSKLELIQYKLDKYENETNPRKRK